MVSFFIFFRFSTFTKNMHFKRIPYPYKYLFFPKKEIKALFNLKYNALRILRPRSTLNFNPRNAPSASFVHNSIASSTHLSFENDTKSLQRESHKKRTTIILHLQYKIGLYLQRYYQCISPTSPLYQI